MNKPKIENDVNLSQQRRIGEILDHHPHTAHMAQHGMIRKSKPHLMALVHKPEKKHDPK